MSSPRLPPGLLFINNEFVPAVSGKTFPVINPHTEEVIMEVAEGDEADVDKAVAAANEAFKTWRKTSGDERYQLLNRLAELIEANADNLALLESLDNGKPVTQARYVDMAAAAQHFRYYAGWAGKNCGKVVPLPTGLVGFTRHEPVGVVGAIVPWNFPLLMATWKIAPALCMGCTIVLKPAEQTPLTALRLAELMVEAGFPPGVLNIITGFGPTAGGALTKHAKVDKITFTGSGEVGKIIQQACAASNLKRCSLELGGKSPLVIFKDADLDFAVETAHQGIFFNAGQVCTASSRVFVEDAIYDDFVAKSIERAKVRKVGDPTHPETDQGPQVSDEQFDRVMGYIEKGKSEGAQVACGGHRVGDKGYFVAPTIFTDVADHMSIAREEIFGPVVCVMKFSSIEEVVERANSTAYGLAAAVLTNDISKAFRFIEDVRAGTVWVNCYNAFASAMPFGGYKESGVGRDNGEYALELYTEVKSVIIKTA